jgi:hypothetical protein
MLQGVRNAYNQGDEASGHRSAIVFIDVTCRAAALAGEQF